MLPPEEEVCCGFPLFITGQHDLLKDLVTRLVDGYQAKRGKDAGLLLSLLREHHDPGLAPVLRQGAARSRSRHITQYVSDAIKHGKLRLNKELRESVIYHDPCYLSRGVGVIEEPRRGA